ncbi:MAG: insulinase family protein, partial [Ignavibacteriales bacterium]|nr:insulinase family protein [Ignavibacteriales bacterium]
MNRMWLLVILPWSIVSGQNEALTVPYEMLKLSNGLTVILHEDHTIPRVAVNMWYHVGSGHEKPGRTGFAHLFEHIMFEGSKNVPEGMFDVWLEAAGGDNNGSTNTDRTNYYETLPSNALELALFLESDRMGYLLDAMSPAKVDGQRDVVKNERRQRYENQPYGMVWITMAKALYPDSHPYSWPTIGSMEDLSAASYEDVAEFFRKYYVSNNASLVIAGDIDAKETASLVAKWFGEIPIGAPVEPIDPPAAFLPAEKRLLLEDRVQLPRLYMAWLTPALYRPGDAEMDIAANVLAGGKNSRLYKRLVYEMQIAQDVSAFQFSAALSSSFVIVATAREGHTLAELEVVVQEEINRLKLEGPAARELQRAVNQFEAGFLGGLETSAGKADQLNNYYVRTGNPDYFNEDLSRYQAVQPLDVRAMMQSFLPDNARVVLSVVPAGKPELAAVQSR